jgi:peptidyl-dipeptidase A
MKKLFSILIFLLLFFSCSKEDKQMEFTKFIEKHVKEVQPLNKQYAFAFWNANATGEKKYYDEMESFEVKIRTIYSNKNDYEFIKKIKESGEIKDPIQQRELIILYNSYLSNQMDSVLMKEIVNLNSNIIKKFNTYRAVIDGKEVTDNQILEVLKNEKSEGKRKAAWEASKQVGKVIEQNLLKLVKLRNQVAVKLGFKNFYEMSMFISEQDPNEIVGIFNKLKESTDEPFRKLKDKMDKILAEKYGIRPDEMKPWHYADPFFQSVPKVSNINFDQYYKGKDIEKLGRDFYSSIGMTVDDILKNSDLYERKGKYPHAFCIDMDREGDVRTMQNINADVNWMETILHELGHGVYSKNVDRSLPYLLRSESHILTTEAIAQMMERHAKNPEWMQANLGISDNEKEEITKVVKEEQQLKALIFCRWSMVMLFFEKNLYENPDQDLNKLWWDLVEKYQFIKRPSGRNEPDYAAKIHLSQSPVYYHNYLLGELMASQLMNNIAKNIYKTDDLSKISFYNNPEVGKYLIEKVFKPGSKYSWNDLIKEATGEFLDPKYYIKQYIQ